VVFGNHEPESGALMVATLRSHRADSASIHQKKDQNHQSIREQVKI